MHMHMYVRSLARSPGRSCAHEPVCRRTVVVDLSCYVMLHDGIFYHCDSILCYIITYYITLYAIHVIYIYIYTYIHNIITL